MSEECNHDCSSCGAECGERSAGKADFAAKPNAASRIGRVVAVMSGKGGVGKSFVAAMLAVAAMKRGLKTGVLDADVTGPSIPKSFGLSGGTYKSADGIEPSMSNAGIKVMSLNMLVDNPSDPVVWRGPIIAGVVKQFWSDVHWGDVDLLVVDMPPGTGDVPLTVFQSLPVEGVVVVTSPQDLVGMIVGKSVKMAQLMGKPVLGLVENMSYLTCPGCGEKINVFGEGGAERLARRFSIPETVRLPIDPSFAAAVDAGAVETVDLLEFESFAAKILQI
ncbi:MAG: Mrp/NBP35 family ATP-binding protein [Kiritimatiellae bacterium]|nr:Mrp/NBP35 family ATP-binding protein [Kiritimatiellia bacterium]